MALSFFIENKQAGPYDEEVLSYFSEMELSSLALISKARNETVNQLALQPLKAKHLATLACQGKQDKADKLLADEVEERRQQLLLLPRTFTDYSGRTFHCTAYEYAWWAKDTHMRRMLEKHMDDETKAKMLERIEGVQKKGLTYHQNSESKNSKHFDFAPLINALEAYVNEYNEWRQTENWRAMKSAWIRGVGKAQRDVVVHVANEYCRKDRSFLPTPQFDENSLPRDLSFIDHKSNKTESWFPLEASSLGKSIGLYRAPDVARSGLGWVGHLIWRPGLQ